MYDSEDDSVRVENVKSLVISTVLIYLILRVIAFFQWNVDINFVNLLTYIITDLIYYSCSGKAFPFWIYLQKNVHRNIFNLKK